jgi:hypothetical protein
MMPDKRMDHQALPVEAGTKFAANGWIHMYVFPVLFALAREDYQSTLLTHVFDLSFLEQVRLPHTTIHRM